MTSIFKNKKDLKECDMIVILISIEGEDKDMIDIWIKNWLSEHINEELLVDNNIVNFVESYGKIVFNF